jgi:hypothetical protein
MPSLGAVDAAVDGLNTFLAAQIPALTVLTEWPAANKKLNYPSVTLTVGLDKRTPIQPETYSVGAPNGSGQVVEALVVADYEIQIQLDLWTRNVAERRQYLNAIIALFNAALIADTGPAGLSLELTNYFNIFARYTIDTHEFRDDELAVERQERRARISLLVNTREIVNRTMYAINTIVVDVGVTTSPEEMTDDTANTESHTIL